jgi:hypothetical protein
MTKFIGESTLLSLHGLGFGMLSEIIGEGWTAIWMAQAMMNI